MKLTRLKEMKKNFAIGGLLLAILGGIFWFYPKHDRYRSLASECENDIMIFNRHIELSACLLEDQIDEKLQSVSDVKITKFRYRPFMHNEDSRIGLIRFSAVRNNDGSEIHMLCDFVSLKIMKSMKLISDELKVSLGLLGCYDNTWETDHMLFQYPVDIIKNRWEKRQKIN